MDDLTNAVAKAEKATQKIADPALRVAAFQTVLQELLQRARASSNVGLTNSGERRSTRKKPAPAASTGTTGRLLTLIEEGVFGEQRSLSDIRQILAERGWHYRLEALGTPVTRLVQRRHLRRVRVADGRKKIWRYSNY